MTNLGEFPRNWFLANAQRIIVACLLSPLSGSVELRVFTMFIHFALKILYHLALVKNFNISRWYIELIHFKSKGVFPSNINRRDKAWWFMIGPSHGIHQSSWLKLHWVVSSSVSLISFLSEPALCVTNVIEILVKGNSSFILDPFPIILNGVTYFLKF